ncbi:MAG: CIA30 family protein [Bryobacteraceae bacterium]
MRICLSLLLAACAGFAGEFPSGSFVVRDARVFDGSRVLEKAAVVVENGRIAALGRDLAPPAGLPVVDGSGRTLLPGLIDSHTHVFGDVLREALKFGVTTELDMFTDYQLARRIKAEQAAGRDADMADLRSAGTLVTAPHGHGTEYGIAIPTITGPQEAQAFVDARIAEGSDYMKIVYTVPLPVPTISQETLAALVEAAHRRGKLAVVHINSRQGAEDAIAAGVDGLAHLFADRAPAPDFGQVAAAHHIFAIPTLTVLPQEGGHAAEAVRQLKAAGVPILAGTDAPNACGHGVGLHGELALLVAAGLTPLEALKAATSAPATAFRLSDRGVIAVGARADLLLVDGDPTTRIDATRSIVAVWKAGYALPAKPANAPAMAPRPISDFEDGASKASFGFGWLATSDQVVGGKSTAEIHVAPGGANGSRFSLAVHGEIRPGFPFAFAGAAFYPGSAPMQPADLSASKAIAFWAKGDGQTYRLMVYSQARGYIPGTQPFTAGPEWHEYIFPLEEFGMDGRDVTAIVFSAGPQPAKFDFQIDEVRLTAAPEVKP